MVVAGAGPGYGALAAPALARAAGRDIVLLCAGVVVADGWLERLATAAHAGALVATASPLTDQRGAAVGLPAVHRPAGLDLARAAARVAAAAPAQHPRLVATNGLCLYVRRSALDVLGGPGERRRGQRPVAGPGARDHHDALVDRQPGQRPARAAGDHADLHVSSGVLEHGEHRGQQVLLAGQVQDGDERRLGGQRG
jgi:hypothetical protein